MNNLLYATINFKYIIEIDMSISLSQVILKIVELIFSGLSFKIEYFPGLEQFIGYLVLFIL